METTMNNDELQKLFTYLNIENGKSLYQTCYLET